MSAITGIYHFNNEPINLEHGLNLMKCLEIYPANDIQVWQKKNIFLGCHAQWITPESIHEQLPFYDSQRQLAITADAIIDNREELFERLQVKHADRKGMPDSQLILLAYEKWGEDSPKYLVGDFAFMIWDERKQQLFGARDFSGGRTLYYNLNREQFIFCTVIHPFFSLPHINKELNEQWLAEYLAISGTIDTVDASISPYKNIEQLPPSHWILIREDKITLKRYCTFSSLTQLRLKTNEEYVEAFQEIFHKAVKSRLRTHLGVGAHLSGGLDSGSIVSFAVKDLKKENKTLHTFSYIPSNDFVDYTPKYLIPDERPFIKSTVQFVGGLTDHYYDFKGRDPLSEINDQLEVMEMPYKFFENSFWLSGIFEKAKEEGMGVLLNGDRGNSTISWGSAFEYYAILLKRLRWVRLFQELDQYSRNVGGARLRRLPIVTRLAFPVIDRIDPSRSPYKPYTFPTIISNEFAKKTNVFMRLQEHGMDQTGWFSTKNIYEQRSKHFEDVSQWNATNTLGTKLSLRHSLWKRDPTNDLRVVQFCLSLPEEQYVQNGLDRALIRRATENLLPDKVRLNQSIRGVQGADWLHRMLPFWDAFIQELHQLSTDKSILGYFNNQVIEASLRKVSKGVKPDDATDPDYRILMRCLIVYRFLKKVLERG